MTDLLIHFCAAMFFINALPHFINGLSGRPFPSPFASPPGQGESPAPLNIVWACVNFGLVGFILAQKPDVLQLNQANLMALIAGAVSTAFILSWWFGRVYKSGE